VEFKTKPQIALEQLRCPAHRDEKLTKPRPEEWLLIEWPESEKEPTKYWLSTLPENIEFAALVDVAKLRWRIGATIRSGSGHRRRRGVGNQRERQAL
jgi:SRSO17 transposase